MDANNDANDGWVLYYSEEGYPYYFNNITGESQWAEVADDNTTYDYQNQTANQSPQQPMVQESPSDEETEDEDDESEDDESDEDDGDDDDDDDDEESQHRIVLDKVLEEKFKAYLQTPEGMAAMEAEQARVNKLVDKKTAKRSTQAEQEYVRSLLNSKKHDDNTSRRQKEEPMGWVGAALAATSLVLENTANLLSAKKTTDTKKDKKSKTGSKPTAISSSNSAYDSQGRETKQRNKTQSFAAATTAASASSSSSTPHQGGVTLEDVTLSVDDNIEAGDAAGSSSSSLSSSSHGSVSSDDSDIIAINAPYFSEIPQWLSLESLHASYIVPASNYLEENHVYENTMNVLSTVATTTVYATQQGLYYTGVGIFSAVSYLFTTLNPVLLNFMRQMENSNTTSNAVSGSSGVATSIEDGSGDDDGGTNSAGLSTGPADIHSLTSRSSRPNSCRAAPPLSARSAGTGAFRAAPPTTPRLASTSTSTTPRAPPTSTPRGGNSAVPLPPPPLAPLEPPKTPEQTVGWKQYSASPYSPYTAPLPPPTPDVVSVSVSHPTLPPTNAITNHNTVRDDVVDTAPSTTVTSDAASAISPQAFPSDSEDDSAKMETIDLNSPVKPSAAQPPQQLESSSPGIVSNTAHEEVTNETQAHRCTPVQIPEIRDTPEHNNSNDDENCNQQQRQDIGHYNTTDNTHNPPDAGQHSADSPSPLQSATLEKAFTFNAEYSVRGREQSIGQAEIPPLAVVDPVAEHSTGATVGKDSPQVAVVESSQAEDGPVLLPPESDAGVSDEKGSSTAAEQISSNAVSAVADTADGTTNVAEVVEEEGEVSEESLTNSADYLAALALSHDSGSGDGEGDSEEGMSDKLRGLALSGETIE